MNPEEINQEEVANQEQDNSQETSSNNFQDFEDRLNNATNPSEEKEIIEEYLDTKYSNFSGYNDIKDILIKLCYELNELEDNPFIIFVDEYNHENDKLPNRQCLTSLNNLFARNIIDEHNLDGTDEDGDIRKSILYNANVYENNVDSEFIITSYYWLSEKGNLNKINYSALANSEDIAKNYPAVHEMAINPTDRSNAVRDVIIYNTNYAPNKNLDTFKFQVRSKKDIEKILHIAASRTNAPTQQRNADNVSQAVSLYAKMNDREKELFLQQVGLDNQ